MMEWLFGIILGLFFIFSIVALYLYGRQQRRFMDYWTTRPQLPLYKYTKKTYWMPEEKIKDQKSSRGKK